MTHNSSNSTIDVLVNGVKNLVGNVANLLVIPAAVYYAVEGAGYLATLITHDKEWYESAKAVAPFAGGFVSYLGTLRLPRTARKIAQIVIAGFVGYDSFEALSNYQGNFNPFNTLGNYINHVAHNFHITPQIEGTAVGTTVAALALPRN